MWKQLLSTTLLHTTARRAWRDCGRLPGIPYLMTFLDMLRRVWGSTVSFGGHARSKQSNLHCSQNITVNFCFQRLWMGDFEVHFPHLNRPQLKQKLLVFCYFPLYFVLRRLWPWIIGKSHIISYFGRRWHGEMSSITNTSDTFTSYRSVRTVYKAIVCDDTMDEIGPCPQSLIYRHLWILAWLNGQLRFLLKVTLTDCRSPRSQPREK